MNVTLIPIDLIDIGERLREVDPDYAALLAVSIAVDGLRTPIEVRLSASSDRFGLVAGAHRLAAARMAGLAAIPAVTLSLDDLTAKRLEIEENLLRHDLTELDRSVFLARWKELYELLTPQVRHGGKRSRNQTAKLGGLAASLRGEGPDGEPLRFTKVAADKFRTSERSMSRAVLRFKRIVPDVRKQIAGTWLADHGSELDLLTRLTPDIQRQVVRVAFERGASSLRGALEEVSPRRTLPPDPDQAQFDALMKLWRRASTKARQLFEAELAKDAQFKLGHEA